MVQDAALGRLFSLSSFLEGDLCQHYAVTVLGFSVIKMWGVKETGDFESACVYACV